MDRYINRRHAGKILAELLMDYKNRADVIVLALPRGGVPIGYEIATALQVPLDVFIVRKLGVPGHEELAMGAVAPNGVTVFNQDIIEDLAISKAAIDQVLINEQAELKRREIKYRNNRPFPNLKNKIIILVDDGIATGATMRAAIQALKKMQPATLIMAIPVAASSSYTEMEPLVDEMICPMKPLYFNAVGLWYEDFGQTTDEEVHDLLELEVQEERKRRQEV